VSTSKLCVAHLVWGPLIDRVERFAASYRAHPAGVEHELVVIFNGLSASERAAAERALEGLSYTPLVPPKPTFDITAYGMVPAQVSADAYLFLNSYSRLLAPDWAKYYVDALDLPGVGLAGATGSWGSMRSWNRWPPEHEQLPPHKLAHLYVAALRPHLAARLRFPPAPWPWIRTNAFALTAETLGLIEWPVCDSKWDTWRAEMGRDCISERVRRTGRRCVVVNRRGEVFEVADWHRSRTSASGDQADLLVADNRTDEYAQASPEERLHRERITWPSMRPHGVK